MGATSNIEWTDATWNPVEGCSMAKGSEVGGCLNCYAARTALRRPSAGLSVMRDSGPRWTGKVQLVEKRLTAPVHWREPKRIFVNSMSDLFHESLDFQDIDRIFWIMYGCQRHTFQILTKRPERMLSYMQRFKPDGRGYVTVDGEDAAYTHPTFNEPCWPIPNIMLGVSVENQATADARIQLLLQAPAEKRFVSYEPALGPVDFTRVRWDLGVTNLQLTETRIGCGEVVTSDSYNNYPPAISVDVLTGYSLAGAGERLDWLIAGGESGPGARPPHPDWFRSARDQCVAAGVPFFFKQWGEWLPGMQDGAFIEGKPQIFNSSDEPERVGKKKAGALLDGREWREFPEVRNVSGSPSAHQ